jgi:hypothetical protein
MGGQAQGQDVFRRVDIRVFTVAAGLAAKQLLAQAISWRGVATGTTTLAGVLRVNDR